MSDKPTEKDPTTSELLTTAIKALNALSTRLDRDQVSGFYKANKAIHILWSLEKEIGKRASK